MLKFIQVEGNRAIAINPFRSQVRGVYKVNETQKIFEKTAKLFCQSLVYQVIKPTLQELSKSELTEVQLSCIRYVHTHSEPSVGAIAAGLSISNAAAAKLTDRLVKKHLLSREEDLRDRRVLKIKLTPDGARLLEEIDRIESQQFQTILSRMSSGEMEALQQGLNGFLRAALVDASQIDQICLHCGWDHLLDCPGNLRYRELTGHDKTEV